MNPALETIVIAAPVLARDADEAGRLVDALMHLRLCKLPIFLVDGGSHAVFIEEVRDLKGISLYSVQGDGARLVSQVRQALAAAIAGSNARYILYTEPDKQWFFENRLDEFISQAKSLSDDSDLPLFVAARDNASFSTFPAFQQATESSLLSLMHETSGFDQDTTYGPLLLPVECVPLLDDLPEDIGWGWRIYLMTSWERMGLEVVFLPDYLPCPPDQRGENEERHRIHRLEQMAQNVRGLAMALRASTPTD